LVFWTLQGRNRGKPSPYPKYPPPRFFLDIFSNHDRMGFQKKWGGCPPPWIQILFLFINNTLKRIIHRNAHYAAFKTNRKPFFIHSLQFFILSLTSASIISVEMQSPWKKKLFNIFFLDHRLVILTWDFIFVDFNFTATRFLLSVILLSLLF